MEVEIYRKKTYELQSEGGIAVDGILADLGPKQDERVELYRTLGFDGLENLQSRLDPADWYPELTPIRYEIWKNFLPTSYVDNEWYLKHSSGEIVHRWSHYCFDKIPVPILKELETVNNLNVFSYIEIRTPERRQSDPVAIGHFVMPNGHWRQFLICRWGESLIPYWQVCFWAYWPANVIIIVPMVMLFLRALSCFFTSLRH